MRKNLLLFGLLALLLWSCDGKIWDIYPVVFNIEVVDAQGVDLLNQENQNAIDTSKILALFRGEEYKCGKDPYFVETKAYLPKFYGLKLSRDLLNNAYVLKFGELDGATSYSNEELTIFWGDGTSDKIRFNRKYRHKLNGDPHISEEWFLNDQKLSGRYIKIIK